MQGTWKAIVLPNSISVLRDIFSLWMDRLNQRLKELSSELVESAIQLRCVVLLTSPFYSRGWGCGRGQPGGIPWAGKGFIGPLSKQSRKCSGDCGHECSAEMMFSPGAVPEAPKTCPPRSPCIPVTPHTQQPTERHKEESFFLLAPQRKALHH